MPQVTSNTPDLTQLYSALQNADKAGDTEGATKLANYIRSITPKAPSQPADLPLNLDNKVIASQASPLTPESLVKAQTTQYGPGRVAAAQAGTDVLSGAPYGLQNKLSLEVSPSPQTQMDTVNQYFGKPVASFGPAGVQFPNPKTGQLTAAMPYEGKFPTAGGTMDTGFDTGGAVGAGALTALVTKNPFAAWAATSGGAAVGQEVSNEFKNLFSRYFNKEPLTGEQQKADLKNAGETGLSSAVMGSLGVLPSIGNYINRGAVNIGSVKALQRVLNAAVTQQNALEDFKGLQLSVPELLSNSTDPSLRAVSLQEKFLGASRARDENFLTTNTPIVDIENARKTRNVNALADAYDDITRQYAPNEGYISPESSYEAAQLVASQKAAQQNQLQLRLDQSVNDTKAAAQPAMSRFNLGKNIVERLQLLKQAGQDAVNKAWGDLKVQLGVPVDEAYGGEPYAAPLGKSPKIGYTSITQSKLTELWQRGMSAMRHGEQGTIGANNKAGMIFDSIPDELYVDPQDPTLGLKFSDPSKELDNVDLHDYIDGIKNLRAGIRRSVRSGNVGWNPDTQIEKNVADILRDNANQWFAREGDPRVLEAWENAERATTDFHKSFNEGLLEQVDSQKAGNRERIFNQFATKVLMSGNDDELSRLANVTNQDPYAQDQMRLGIWSLIHEGIQSARTPQQLVRNYQSMVSRLAPTFKHFFGPGDLENMDTFDALTNKVDQLHQQYTDFNKEWSQSEFRDTPASVSGIRKALFDANMPVDRIGKLYAFLSKENPQLLQGVKADMADAFAKSVSNKTPDGYVPDLTKMTSALGDRSTQAKIRLFLGGDYLTRASAIRDVAKLMAGPNQPEVEAPKSMFEQIIRMAVAPPLSREGRAYTGLLMWRHRAAARALYNALSSTDGLRSYINLANSRNTRAQVIGALGALNASSLASVLPSQPAPQATGSQSGP